MHFFFDVSRDLHPLKKVHAAYAKKKVRDLRCFTHLTYAFLHPWPARSGSAFRQCVFHTPICTVPLSHSLLSFE